MRASPQLRLRGHRTLEARPREASRTEAAEAVFWARESLIDPSNRGFFRAGERIRRTR
jgi:hypothetical protein